MEKLIEIKNSCKEQFFKTGKINFFMMAHNLETLIENVKNVEELKQEDETFSL